MTPPPTHTVTIETQPFPDPLYRASCTCGDFDAELKSLDAQIICNLVAEHLNA